MYILDTLAMLVVLYQLTDKKHLFNGLDSGGVEGFARCLCSGV
jgi:hypothetical protein